MQTKDRESLPLLSAPRPTIATRPPAACQVVDCVFSILKDAFPKIYLKVYIYFESGAKQVTGLNGSALSTLITAPTVHVFVE